MPDNEIPPAEQSVAKMIDLQHQIAEEHTPHGTSVGKIISPPPDVQIAWNNIILKYNISNKKSPTKFFSRR